MMNSFVISNRIANQLNRNFASMALHMQRVASGQRINSVADDPSGWAIGQRMSVEIRSLNQALSNTQRSQSMLKVADGGVSSTIDILRTLKEKAIDAANDSNTDADRKTIQKLFDQYADQIDDNAYITYNGKYLLDGSHLGRSQLSQQAYTNELLSTDTKADTKLTELLRRDGSSAGILEGDTIGISFVKDGKTYTTSIAAKDATTGKAATLADVFAAANAMGVKAGIGEAFDTAGMSYDNVIGTDGQGTEVHTASEENAVTVKAKTAGTGGSIAGFAFSVMHTNGQVDKGATNLLNGFTESIQATDARADNMLTTQSGTRANQNIRTALGDMRSTARGLRGSDGSVINVSTKEGANAAIAVLDNALAKALDQSTTIGAYSSRMDYTVSNLTTQSTNVQAAMSTIMDADLAKEITEYAKSNILAQAAMAMLAQSNQNAGWFLKLLG